MKWIIELDKSNDKADVKFWKSLSKKTENYKIFEYKPFMSSKDIREEIGEISEPVLFLGSIAFINKVQKISEYIPGTFCNFDAFRCKRYYPILGDLMLNSDHIIVTWGDLLKNSFEGVRFIRPDSGKKVFTGTITDYDHLTQDVGLSVANIQPETLVLVTSVKDVKKEWRFFVRHGEVLTGCQYHENNKLNIDRLFDVRAYLLADKVCQIEELNNLIKDPVYVVDICLTSENQYKVMELNSFSCSGLYACDTDILVLEIERLLKGE